MYVIVGAAVGPRLERDLAALLPLQYEDGGCSWIYYKYGSSGMKIGNRGQAGGEAGEGEGEGEEVVEKRELVEITPLPLPQLPVTAAHVRYTRPDNNRSFVVYFINCRYLRCEDEPGK
jgi:hypothetical protein